MKNQRDFRAGDLVRYGSGSTALAILHSPHAGGWHADQCMGGSTYIGSGRTLSEPDEEDLRTWQRCAWYRGQGIPPSYRPRIRKKNGRYQVLVLPQVPQRWVPLFNQYVNTAMDFVQRRNEEEQDA